MPCARLRALWMANPSVIHGRYRWRAALGPTTAVPIIGQRSGAVAVRSCQSVRYARYWWLPLPFACSRASIRHGSSRFWDRLVFGPTGTDPVGWGSWLSVLACINRDHARGKRRRYASSGTTIPHTSERDNGYMAVIGHGVTVLMLRRWGVDLLAHIFQA